MEAVVEQHPAVADLGVFAKPDAKWGELLCIAIVTKPKQHLSLAQLDAYCRDKIAAYKIPKYLLLLDKIPRNHTGKVLRQELTRLASKTP